MPLLIAIGTLLIGPALLLASDEKVRPIRFSDKDQGKVPSGWKADHTGKGEGSIWKVVADDTAPSKSGYVLAQTAESPNAYFNICVADDTNYKDVELSVSFRPSAVATIRVEVWSGDTGTLTTITFAA